MNSAEAGVGDHPEIDDRQVVVQARVLARVGHDQRRGRRDDLAAEGVRQRRLAALATSSGRPIALMNTWRSSSTSETSAIGTSSRREAARVRRSKAGSGRPSISSRQRGLSSRPQRSPPSRVNVPLFYIASISAAYFAADRLALELHRRRQLVAAGHPVAARRS